MKFDNILAELKDSAKMLITHLKICIINGVEVNN